MTDTIITHPAPDGGTGENVVSPAAGKNTLVVPPPCEDLLLARLSNLAPLRPGMRLLIIRIPGLEAKALAHSTVASMVDGVLKRLIPLDSMGEVYGLSDDRLAVLMTAVDDDIYAPLERALVKTFQKTPGEPQALRFDLVERFDDACELLRKTREAVSIISSEAARLDALKKLATVRFQLGEPERALRANRGQPVVLLVEDDPSTVLLLTSLVKLDARIVSAANAADAVALYKRYVPDVVFLDIGLPDVDGLTLLEQITRGDGEAYVIMLTANAYLDNLEKARRRGAKGFVAKPFNQGKIHAVLQRALRERETKTS